MGSVQQPRTYESFTDAVDQLASKSPSGHWLTMPISANLGQWRDVTWSELSQAVSRMARWIDDNVGAVSRGNGRKTLAYIG